jgi:Cu-Zn family superoxide dismutase
MGNAIFHKGEICMKIRIALAATALCIGLHGPAFSAESMTIEMKNAKGEDIGEAQLTQIPQGVLIQATLAKLPPGEHGFHLHAVGKCEPPFTSAGDHFNPDGKQHGYLAPQGQHAGDLPNIHVPESGAVKIDMLAPQVTLKDGQNRLADADGATLMIHAKPDDYQSQPSGEAGDRIACGVIGKPAA